MARDMRSADPLGVPGTLGTAAPAGRCPASLPVAASSVAICLSSTSLLPGPGGALRAVTDSQHHHRDVIDEVASGELEQRPLHGGLEIVRMSPCQSGKRVAQPRLEVGPVA